MRSSFILNCVLKWLKRSSKCLMIFELWRMKRNLKILKECTGNGTYMISLNIPPNEQVYKVVRMSQEEMAAAERIKYRRIQNQLLVRSLHVEAS